MLRTFFHEILRLFPEERNGRIQDMRDYFLPISESDMRKRGWPELDVLLVSADAYVDHPSFACALLGRLLESHGYRVGIIAQPDWRNKESLLVMGKPRLCCMISGGNIDSMVAHYTSTKKKRSTDQYSPGGKSLQPAGR